MVNISRRATGIKTVVKRDGRKVPFDETLIKESIRKAIDSVEVRPEKEREEEARKFTRQTVCRLKKGELVDENGSLRVDRIREAVLDTLHHDMARDGCSLSTDPEGLWMAFMLNGQSRCLMREGKLAGEYFHDSAMPVQKVQEARHWSIRHGCDSIAALNSWFDANIGQLIKDAETNFNNQLQRLATRLNYELNDGLRAVLIAGPSSSGKTTTTRKAVDMLMKLRPDIGFKSIEIDNYFKEREYHEKMHFHVDGRKVEDVNYELPESYDIELVNEHLEALMKGKGIVVPRYDFAKGKRSVGDATMCLGQNEVLIIDCMHALSPQLTEAIPANVKFRLYLEAISVLADESGSVIPWSDLRLMRRLLRDVRTRGHSIPENLWHWQLVRKGERFMLPYIYTADMMIDTGLPYELPMLKRQLEIPLLDLAPLFERNPDLFDGCERAKRILRLFRQFKTARQDQMDLVPSDSLLREFIG